MALSRIFNLYGADRSSKVGENWRTRGKKTPDHPYAELDFPTCDPSEARTIAVRNPMDEVVNNPPGPCCSKLTTSLVNNSLKFTSSDTQIC